MKKCARCGLLNAEKAQSCSNCGFTAFEEKPAHVPGPKPSADIANPRIAIERHGAMMTLKCRTPAEAWLVRENVEFAGISALLPDEREMVLQHNQKGYVELEIPAAAYDSARDLRSIVEFSAPPPLPPGIGLPGKILAMFLAALIVPGLLIFAWLLTSYKKHGEDRKARELKLWFFIGLAF
jgi:hypothetical protein